jgi:heat shock protein HslJ
MRRVLLGILTLVLALVGAPPAFAQEADQLTQLVGSHWGLARLDGTAVPARAGIDIAFTRSGRVIGSGGCNGFTGSWTHLGGDGLYIGDISVGRTACPGPRGTTEVRFLDRILLATTFAVDGRRLTIAMADGDDLVFRRGDPTGAELVGDWALATIDGEAATDIPRSTLTFDDTGGMSGSGGCNPFTGSWAVHGTAIHVGSLAAHRATCSPHAIQQEQAFLRALGGAVSWTVIGDTLRLAGKRGRHPMTLAAIRPVSYGLSGTTWTIDTVTGAHAPAASTIRFDADGTVSGSAGCDSYRGPWSLDPDGIVLHIGPLLATRVACDQGVRDMESAYLAALEDVIGYKTPGGASLVLTTATDVSLSYDPPAVPSLTGTTWSLTEVLGTPFAELAPVNILFSDDGTLTGFGGCALYSGSFQLRGDTLTIEDITGGGSPGCQRSVSDFEVSFLAILPFVQRMSFAGVDLLLWSGEQPLRFRAR